MCKQNQESYATVLTKGCILTTRNWVFHIHKHKNKKHQTKAAADSKYTIHPLFVLNVNSDLKTGFSWMPFISAVYENNNYFSFSLLPAFLRDATNKEKLTTL